MKKLLLAFVFVFVPALPALAASTADCQKAYGNDFVANSSGLCVNSSNLPSGQTPVVVTPNTGTGGSGTSQTGTNQTASQFCTGGSCTYVPLEPINGLPGCYGPNPPSTCKNASTGSFASLIPATFKILIGGGAIIAVVMIVLGALTYMFSDVVGNKTKALSRIRNAMWAVVLLVSSYLILNTINPDLTKLSLTLNTSGNFNTSPSAQTTSGTTLTTAQIQAIEKSCTDIGQTAHKNSDGTYACK